PLDRAPPHVAAVIAEADGEDGVPARAEGEDFVEQGIRRLSVAPEEKREGGLEALAEDRAPLVEAVHVVAGDPVLQGAAGATGMLAALDVDEQVRAGLAVNDEVEAL